jgi:hypothetical protein
MAVGAINRCGKCDEYFDSGKENHFMYCDGGERVREEAARLAAFNAKSVDERLQILYLDMQRLQKKVGSIPYDGAIG